MEKATFDQAAHLLELVKQKERSGSCNWLQDLYDSGILSDVFDIPDPKKVNRAEVQRAFGLLPPVEIVPAATPSFLPVPADDEEFELTINGDEVDPLDMMQRDGFSDWRFNGPLVSGTHTRRFKIVRAGGYCRDLAEVKQRVGKLAEGQWREAFRKKYPRPDGCGPIGFGGSTWVAPYDHRRFPYLHESGGAWYSYFRWADSASFFLGHWRWLVEVSK